MELWVIFLENLFIALFSIFIWWWCMVFDCDTMKKLIYYLILCYLILVWSEKLFLCNQKAVVQSSHHLFLGSDHLHLLSIIANKKIKNYLSCKWVQKEFRQDFVFDLLIFLIMSLSLIFWYQNCLRNASENFSSDIRY